jgi:hypothetical protein
MESKGVAIEGFPIAKKGRIEPFIEEFNKYCYFRRKPSNISRFFLDSSEVHNRPIRARIYKRLLIDGSRLVGGFISLRALSAFEKAIWQVLHGLDVEKQLLSRLKPDLVVSTMPLSNRLERPLLWAAEDLNIRRACVVQSWDNLTTKGMFPVTFDLYIVWSEYMRMAALREFPYLDPQRVVATGVPQFDFYRYSDFVLPREDFFKRIGGDPTRPLIVWTGIAPGLMPGEPKAVALLCEELRARRVREDPQLLLRPHPIGGGARFAATLQQYPELLFTETNDKDPETLIHWSPTLDDLVLQVSTVAHADVNINGFSTMTLDSCILNRPVVNIAFDEREPGKSSARLRRFYDFEYYQIVLETGAVRLATTIDEMTKHLNAYIDNPDLDHQNRARLVEIQCGRVDGQSAVRTAASILTAARHQTNFDRQKSFLRVAKGR